MNPCLGTRRGIMNLALGSVERARTQTGRGEEEEVRKREEPRSIRSGNARGSNDGIGRVDGLCLTRTARRREDQQMVTN
jgi:hypothetical protein